VCGLSEIALCVFDIRKGVSNGVVGCFDSDGRSSKQLFYFITLFFYFVLFFGK
jgi:hypothetical protein